MKWRRVVCWLVTRHERKRLVAVHQTNKVYVLKGCACGHSVEGRQFTGQFPRPR